MKNFIELKKNSKKNLKKHYWHAVLICFLIGIIVNLGYKYNTAIIVDNSNTINIASSNLETIESFLNKFKIGSFVTSITDFKPTRGIIATVFNQTSTTGSLSFGVLNILNHYIFHDSVNNRWTIIIDIILILFILIFVQNILLVNKNRYFLERRKYKNTPVDKIFFIYRIRRTRKVALIMLQKQIYSLLWDLTIIGGFIKHYEYLMIPYILAENPDISSKECFKLSKEMVYGNKFNLFKLDISLIGYTILGSLTLGLTNIFYFYPYKDSLIAEIYMKYRNDLISYDSSYNNYFKDKLLDESGEIYLPEKYFIKTSKRRKWMDFDYNKNYKLDNLILFFFTFSFIGYIWEVLLHFVNTGNFANRGTLFGPWLPIYGTGGVLILGLLEKYKKSPYKLFFGSVLISGIVEYFTSWYLEFFKGLRWWDYKGYFLNINGRICLEGLLVFGIGGYAITYFIVPILDNLYNKINKKNKLIIIIILVSLFSFDFVNSHYHPNIGKGITKTIEKQNK